MAINCSYLAIASCRGNVGKCGNSSMDSYNRAYNYWNNGD